MRGSKIKESHEGTHEGENDGDGGEEGRASGSMVAMEIYHPYRYLQDPKKETEYEETSRVLCEE